MYSCIYKYQYGDYYNNKISEAVFFFLKRGFNPNEKVKTLLLTKKVLYTFFFFYQTCTYNRYCIPFSYIGFIRTSSLTHLYPYTHIRILIRPKRHLTQLNRWREMNWSGSERSFLYTIYRIAEPTIVFSLSF